MFKKIIAFLKLHRDAIIVINLILLAIISAIHLLILIIDHYFLGLVMLILIIYIVRKTRPMIELYTFANVYVCCDVTLFMFDVISKLAMF